MKKWIFLGLGMVIGAGIGVLSVRGHYRKLAFDEINEARDVFRKMAAAKDAVGRNIEMKKEIMSDISEKPSKKDDFGRFSEISKPYLGENRQNYNVFSNPPSVEEEDEEDEEDDPYEITVDHESPRDGYSEPYEITEDEFASYKLFYDKVMIEYYTDGVAVLEDSDQIIDCIEDLIGPDILSGKNSRMSKWDGDEIYIRNDNRSTDYGIIFTGTEYVPEEGLLD